MNLIRALAAAGLLPWLFDAACAEATFYGDPPDDRHPWAIHDPNRPQPPLVTPGTFSWEKTK
jgi:hypothetical protein